MALESGTDGADVLLDELAVVVAIDAPEDVVAGVVAGVVGAAALVVVPLSLPVETTLEVTTLEVRGLEVSALEGVDDSVAPTDDALAK